MFWCFSLLKTGGILLLQEHLTTSRHGREARPTRNDRADWRMLNETNNSPRYKLPPISLGGLIASKGSPASNSKSLPVLSGKPLLSLPDPNLKH